MQYPLKKLLLLVTVILSGFIFTGAGNLHGTISENNSFKTLASDFSALYNEMGLQLAGLNADVFNKAVDGFQKLNNQGSIKKDDIITIVDFSQPSTKKRLYVIDLEHKKVLFNTLVAHGKNSGTLWAKSFSNQFESLKSSPGFYTTGETYNGENGYSLRLDGLERNINSNARNRAIVMHGAPYVNQSTINAIGYIGRSWGCPAVPVKEHKQIINTIKDGTCLFIFSPDKGYVSRSTLLNANV